MASFLGGAETAKNAGCHTNCFRHRLHVGKDTASVIHPRRGSPSRGPGHAIGMSLWWLADVDRRYFSMLNVDLRSRTRTRGQPPDWLGASCTPGRGLALVTTGGYRVLDDRRRPDRLAHCPHAGLD